MCVCVSGHPSSGLSYSVGVTLSISPRRESRGATTWKKKRGEDFDVRTFNTSCLLNKLVDTDWRELPLSLSLVYSERETISVHIYHPVTEKLYVPIRCICYMYNRGVYIGAEGLRLFFLYNRVDMVYIYSIIMHVFCVNGLCILLVCYKCRTG
jgi:hypothetical protein